MITKGEVAAELDGANAAKITSNTADLETWEGAQSSIAAALHQHKRIDVQVNNVGGTIWAKPFHDYEPDQIQAEINRSLFPTLWSCRAVIPHMIKRRAGVIVNVSSVATRGLNRVPYGAAKGGVNSITKNLAWELAEYGIRVCAAAPGGTDAPARKVARGPAARGRKEKLWYETLVDQTISSSLMHRYGSLDEQAAVITFLASPEASYLTGVIVPVGGGDLGG